MKQPLGSQTDVPDLDKFRLRVFAEQLLEAGEVEVIEDPIDLIDVAKVLDGHPKAVLFQKVGPEQADLFGNVMGSKTRLAAAFGVQPAQLANKIIQRMTNPKPTIEISSENAPVHDTILTGNSADFTKLPVHLQHEMDGGPYISAGIDFAMDPETGWVNVGSRRLMLMGRQTAGLNLTAPSDLRHLYQKAVANGETLPVSFTVGSHPTDFLAAAMRVAVDELGCEVLRNGIEDEGTLFLHLDVEAITPGGELGCGGADVKLLLAEACPAMRRVE